jgi:hypothetical protein
MNFTNWLTKISDFVSLGSIVTNGGPGIILALSLFVIGAHVMHIPLFVMSDRDFPTSEPPTIKRQETAVEGKEQEVTLAEQAKAAIDSEMADLQADLKALDGRIDGTEKQSVAAERTEQLKARRDARRQELQLLVAAKASSEMALSSKRRQLAVAQKELDLRIAGQTVTATNLLDNMLSHLIGATLIGYILGSLLSPINRVLFLDWGNAIARWFQEAVR